MKRCIVGLLVAVLCVPLFTVSAWAEDLVMKSVVESERLPVGYVYPLYPGAVNSWESSSGIHEMFFYSMIYDMYFRIKFNGDCELTSLWGRFSPKFTGDVVSIQAYPCNGRDVFTVTPEHTLTIRIPAAKIADVVPSSTGSYTSSITDDFGDEWMLFDFEFQYSSNGQIAWATPWYYNLRTGVKRTPNGIQYSGAGGSSGGGTITFPSSDVNLKALNIPITEAEFSQKHFDYYVVQKAGSDITSTIDYQFTYKQENGLLSINGRTLFGDLVAIRKNMSQVSDSVFTYTLMSQKFSEKKDEPKQTISQNSEIM